MVDDGLILTLLAALIGACQVLIVYILNGMRADIRRVWDDLNAHLSDHATGKFERRHSHRQESNSSD